MRPSDLVDWSKRTSHILFVEITLLFVILSISFRTRHFRPVAKENNGGRILFKEKEGFNHPSLMVTVITSQLRLKQPENNLTLCEQTFHAKPELPFSGEETQFQGTHQVSNQKLSTRILHLHR